MASVEAILQRVRACGERVTIQRRLVIEALCHQGNHLTITDIQQHLRQRDEEHALPDVTVYRVLQWLKELGLVSQTDMGTSGTVYELVSEPWQIRSGSESCLAASRASMRSRWCRRGP